MYYLNFYLIWIFNVLINFNYLFVGGCDRVEGADDGVDAADELQVHFLIEFLTSRGVAVETKSNTISHSESSATYYGVQLFPKL